MTMEHEKLTSLDKESPHGSVSDFASVFALVSTLQDGQLRGEEFAQACAALGADAQIRQRWRDYHVVGDVLRGGAAHAVPASRMGDELFLSRLRTQLMPEGSGESPRGKLLDSQGGDSQHDRRRNAQDSANDPYGAWRLTASLCLLMIVGVLGWQGVAGFRSAAQARQWAQTRPDAGSRSVHPDTVVLGARQAGVMPASVSRPTPVQYAGQQVPMSPALIPAEAFRDEPAVVMLRDPRLDRLIARQQNGGFAKARSGRPGVAAQGVLVNLEKSPVAPR